METFLKIPYSFWYEFVYLVLFCTGVASAVQCWFLINFCNIKSRKIYYIIYALISYSLYLFSISINIDMSPLIDTLMGVIVLFIFLSKVLGQNKIISIIASTLAMAVTSIGESLMFLLGSFIIKDMEASQIASILDGLLFPFISFCIYKFFVTRYSVKNGLKSTYFLVFALPIFFIAVTMRIVNYMRYSVTMKGIVFQSNNIQNYEIAILMIVAFLCIWIVLFAYEKTIKQVESENQKVLLTMQLSAQENYVAEAKQKYETTKDFRHDFKNHIIVLKGLINQGNMEKASEYMERFEHTCKDMSFHIDTGNGVIDTLLAEKLSYAKQLGICIKWDIIIPSNMQIDDFDLCAVFANIIDNAIKACKDLENQDKLIDIVAKPNKSFFVIDVINNYRAGIVEKGSGIGLKTIEIIAKKYFGVVEISDKDNVFRISIVLPFDEKQYFETSDK